jgi:RNA polymerase sigma-70 factor (ECF subfamily)
LPGNAGETELGGPGREFPVTHWSLIAGVQDSSISARNDALESLCRRYWKPVYHHVRRAWSKSSEDAKDLTQAFFVELLSGEALRRYLPEKAGFRTYLKMILRSFAANQHNALNALKRGGAARLVELDAGETPLADLLPDDRAANPEELFDRSWKEEVLSRAMERARQWFADTGRAVQFRAFEEYELSGAGENPTYAQVGAKVGISESDVRNYLFAVRERLRGEIRAEISQTVLNPEQLEEEWNDLFGA